MKKILIIGRNSYIGNSFEAWIGKWKNCYTTSKISIRNEEWKTQDFSVYDVVLYTAGIAHKKENKKNAELYYSVNRDLAYEVALKAKNEGVKQFIFLSSMSVYGRDTGVIKNETLPAPKNDYGKSKLQAENLIIGLMNERFKTAIIRPPMVYGENCKGNYQGLRLAALRLPIFPNIKNQRSMIYIDNLNEFLRLIIENKENGKYHPQNNEYVCTSQMVKLIAKANTKSLWLLPGFNHLIKILNIKIFKKIFGDLTYDMQMSKYIDNYCVYSFQKTIFLTEGED